MDQQQTLWNSVNHSILYSGLMEKPNVMKNTPKTICRVASVLPPILTPVPYSKVREGKLDCGHRPKHEDQNSTWHRRLMGR